MTLLVANMGLMTTKPLVMMGELDFGTPVGLGGRVVRWPDVRGQGVVEMEYELGSGDLVDVIHPVVAPLDRARVHAARDALPWPVKGAPFEVDTMASIIGVYVGGGYWEPHAPPFVRCGPSPVSVPAEFRIDALDGLSGLLHAYAAWHTYDFDTDGDVSASPAWLARLLTMFSWMLLPSWSDGELTNPNMRPVTAARANARCAIVPGGNLHGLVVGGWALARALAEVLVEVIEAESFEPVSPHLAGPVLMPSRLADALRGVAPIPGHALGVVAFGEMPVGAINRDEFASEYVWGRQSMGRVAA